MRFPLRLLTLLWVLLAPNAFANFEVMNFKTGSALKQTALLTDDQLVVFNSHLDESRTFQRFNLESTEALGEAAKLPDSVILVDEMTTAEGVEVVLVHRGRVTRLGDDATLLAFESIYNVPVFQVVPRLDVFSDLNGDGLDDFLIPTFDGYSVAVQFQNGKFTQPITLRSAPLMDMSYNSHPWYQAKNLFKSDFTGDGRVDLAFWQPGEFQVYSQLEDGSFSQAPVSLPSDVVLDYDSVDGMSLRFSNEDQSNKTVKVIHSLADYTGDGTVDLMAMEVKSEGVFNKTTTFALHGGEIKSGFVQFSQDPMTEVQSNGIQYEMFARDLDADGDLDLMVSSVQLGVAKIIGALLTSSLKIDLGFYPMEQGEYSAKPATTRNITASFSLTSGEYWLPAVQIIDQNTDGLLDLLIQDSDIAMSVFLGEASDRLFSNRGETIRTAVPKDPDLIRPVGASGLLMQIPPPLGETSGHRVVWLKSRVQ